MLPPRLYRRRRRPFINRNITRFLMGTRGRKSTAELGVAHGIPQRPKPPADLTPDQAVEWQAVVSRMPVDWFPREIWPLLCAYCRHVTNSRHIAGLIEDAHKGDLSDRKALMRYNRLLWGCRSARVTPWRAWPPECGLQTSHDTRPALRQLRPRAAHPRKNCGNSE